MVLRFDMLVWCSILAGVAGFGSLLSQCSCAEKQEVNAKPSVAVIYSTWPEGQKAGMNAFDDALNDLGLKADKYENTKIADLIKNLGKYDMVLCGMCYNLDNTQELGEYADAWKEFLQNGGILVVNDLERSCVDWLPKIDNGLEVKIGMCSSRDKRLIATSHSILTNPNKTSIPFAFWGHFTAVGDKWEPILKCEDGGTAAMVQKFGKGAVLVSAAIATFSRDGNFLENLWVYIRGKPIREKPQELTKNNPDIVISSGANQLSKTSGSLSGVLINKDNALLVDGKPFFPIATCHVPKEDFGKLKEQGFNAVLLQLVTVEDFKVSLKSALGAHLKAIPLIPLGTRGWDEKKGRELISALKEDPAVLVWQILEEPHFLGVMPEDALVMCRLVKSIDPSHPVYGTKAPIDYDESLDILSAYTYPPPGTPIRKDAELIREIRERSQDKKPVWYWAPAYVQPGNRIPTPKELHCMVYVAIINGAKGLIYYIDKPLDKLGDIWQEMKRINTEINELTPIILSPSIKQETLITTDSPECYILEKECEGQKYLLVTNTGQKDINVTFELPKVTKNTKIEALFENRNLVLSGNSFQDNFSSYAVHVYKIIT